MGQADHLIVRSGTAAGLAPAFHGTSNDPASTATPTEAVRPTLLRDHRDRTPTLSTDPSPVREKNTEEFMPHSLTPPHGPLSMTA
ncbi:hypothetical protein Sgleb_44430 [Streptomyces glebosus]|uniref:Uncharacterized protein n=1 Tax=Streptomyces glebosus TaxID=249580 RepID=A0A640T298_9ACTN|nr:hypothetical protein Sgleb_44430 [Streptomyces glebosus]GHG64622.1 hypothetical protein GCM10010513_32780 [Streptomyces glebosus]